jgi:hypothetical protein
MAIILIVRYKVFGFGSQEPEVRSQESGVRSQESGDDAQSSYTSYL